jgi:tRNA A64-2'-O-ribosylphosphate transferase
LNLQLLSILGDHGGAVIIDSTRRGKNLPDAFSRTVPIWVAVINRVLFPEFDNLHDLQTPPPPDDLGQSEVSQIQSRLQGFAQAFTELGIDTLTLRERLRRPIRLSWAIHGVFQAGYDGDYTSSSYGSSDGMDNYNHLVLCSASRRVRGAETSEGGYIQGAGDDSEAWSHGLTPDLFWRHQEELLATPEEDLQKLIQHLLNQGREETDGSSEAIRIAPTSNLYLTKGRVIEATWFDLVISCEDKSSTSSDNLLELHCRSGKLGSKDLREKLAAVTSRVSTLLRKDAKSRIVVTCSTGKDLSVGVTVALLCYLFEPNGSLRLCLGPPEVDKHIVKQRLAWITNAKPDANPSRATLQAVNSFLMQRPA